MKRNIIPLVAALVMLSCSDGKYEENARQLLNDARISLAAKQFDAARQTVRTLRTEYPRAIAARREALLLEDSIEMEAALDSLLMDYPCVDLGEMAMRAEFYKRKLKHDAAALSK